MSNIDPIYVGKDAIAHLIEYCTNQQLNRLVIVADTITYAALGQRAEQALRGAGLNVQSIVLTGPEVIADERYLIRTLVQAPLEPCTFIAVGSGTLTDITRFTSHRTGRTFISLPTAPSVDGFASVGAPIVLDGVKVTLPEHAPRAIFADLDTLVNAPQRLIAAGFGDMVAKISSLADWQLGRLLWDEPFDEKIFARTKNAVQQCLDAATAIGNHTEDGVRILFQALIESGMCMMEIGNSRPASGAEHHTSHYIEMKLLLEHRAALLHGAKVGYALTRVARQYDKIRALTRREVLDRLEESTLPDREQEIARIHEGYGPLAEGVIKESAAFLALTPERYDVIKQRIATHWDEIQAIAGQVLPADQISAYLQQAGGPTSAQEMGLSEEEVNQALEYGHYLRNRFTVMKLSRMIGLPLH